MDRDAREMLLLNESNETEWWSSWATIRWFNDKWYTSTSQQFNEPLFNRCGIVSPNVDMESDMILIKKAFGVNETVPSFFIPDEPEYSHIWKKLINNGYGVKDHMDVLYTKLSSVESIINHDVEVKAISRRGLHEWASIYIRSFGEETSKREDIIRVLRASLDRKGVTLLLAKWRGMPAGVTAVYSKNGVTGLYCIGVIPELRGKGIGASLVNEALIGASDSSIAILQTFRSDSVNGFYEKAGFKLAFSKLILVNSGAWGQNAGKSSELEQRDNVESICTKGALNYRLPAGVSIERSPSMGEHRFNEVFHGFETMPIIKKLFKDPYSSLNELKVIIDVRPGYMHVDDETGSIYISYSYLLNGDPIYLYLDIIHELVHVVQFKRGLELYDERYPYFKRPTEIEAYRVTISEARSLGLKVEEIIEYLKVEWATDKEFQEFIETVSDLLN